MDKFDHVISLGYVCDVTSYLGLSKQRKQAYVFDRVATPMWSVYELIKNGFKDYLLKENLTSDKLFENDKHNIVFDSKYYVRFAIPERSINELHEGMHNTMIKRKNRLINILKGDEKVLFIRSQELNSYPGSGDRLEREEYAEKYAKSELEYLRLLCSHIRSKYPQLSFKVLFLSDEGEFVDQNNLIVGIPKCDGTYKDRDIGKKMAKHLHHHSDFINSHL